MTALAAVVYQMVRSPEMQARVAQDPHQALPALGLNADEIKSVLRVLQSDLFAQLTSLTVLKSENAGWFPRWGGGAD
ncbi:MAG: hypothetical protein Fur0021_18370 [Candidatus Promineifilaceae bacterium]